MTNETPESRHHPRAGITAQTHTGHDPRRRHGGHRLMMLLCCIPMIAVAVVLVATGVANAGFIVVALVCLGMMAAMMFLMPDGHDHR